MQRPELFALAVVVQGRPVQDQFPMLVKCEVETDLLEVQYPGVFEDVIPRQESHDDYIGGVADPVVEVAQVFSGRPETRLAQS